MDLPPKARAYYMLYKHHYGGAAPFPVFRGSKQEQYGEGFGDVLQNIWRWIRPVISSAAGTFVSNLAQQKESGASWADAAKASIKPTITKSITSGAEQVSRALDQAGHGRRRKRKGRSHNVYKRKRKLNAEVKFNSNEKFPRYNF